MGLDSVHLVIDIEEKFGISIPDKDATAITTVGELIDYVHGRVNSDGIAKCWTASCFYGMRRVLLDCIGVSASAVRLGRKMDDLIPWAERRRVWRRFREQGYQLPPLRLRKPLSDAIMCIAFCVPCLVVAISVTREPTSIQLKAVLPLLMALFAACMVIWATLLVLLRPFARLSPIGCETMREAVYYVTSSTASNVESRDDATPSIGRGEVANRVRAIVSGQMGIPIEELADDKRFIQDLGMD
jgi:acyl carrier protein